MATFPGTPSVKVRIPVRFPARVTVQSPLILTKTGADYEFSFDAGAAGISGDTHNADTVTAFELAAFDSSTKVVNIAGYSIVGIGALKVRRVNSEPFHPWKFRSMDRFLADGLTDAANGGWWEGIADNSKANIFQFGALDGLFALSNTTNAAGSGTASASSEFNGGSYQSLAAYAFAGGGGGATDGWGSNSGNPQWLKYDFGLGQEKTLVGYTLFRDPDQLIGWTNTYAPVSWLFQGSNNNFDWNTLDSQNGYSILNTDGVVSFPFVNATAYRYYRIYITSNANAQGVNISRMQLLTGTLTFQDSTLAIQSAIEFFESIGGGTVEIPPGNFAIAPPTATSTYALVVGKSGISIVGEGMDFSKLTFFCHGGANPLTDWNVQAGAVLRGRAISLPYPFIDFSLSGVEIDGQCPATNDYTFPANPGTGSGWDITNQCVYLGENISVDNVSIVKCRLHRFRGELIYYGGAGLDHILVESNVIGDTSADGISFSAANETVINNDFFTCTAQAIENAFVSGIAGLHLYRGNKFRDMYRFALVIFPATEGVPYGSCEVSDNVFYNCNKAYSYSTILCAAPQNLSIVDNKFYDCKGDVISSNAVSRGGSNLPTVHIPNSGLTIYDNQFIVDQTNEMANGIALYSNGPAPGEIVWNNLNVYDNIAYQTPNALANGYLFQSCLAFNSNGRLDTDGFTCYFSNNVSNNGTKDDTSATSVGNKVILASPAAPVYMFHKHEIKILKVAVSLKVTGGSNVTCSVVFGGVTLLAATSLAPGTYSYFGAVNPTSGDGATTALAVTASILNVVYVSATIDGW